MACGRGGYVGLVRLEDRRLNVAAAFDLAAARREGGRGCSPQRCWSKSGCPFPVCSPSALARNAGADDESSAAAAERLFVWATLPVTLSHSREKAWPGPFVQPSPWPPWRSKRSTTGGPNSAGGGNPCISRSWVAVNVFAGS